MRVFGCEARPRNESEHAAAFRGLTADRFLGFTPGSEFEHSCWDPKDGELCLNRAKPEETLVEARSDSDVQIDRRIWV